MISGDGGQPADNGPRETIARRWPRGGLWHTDGQAHRYATRYPALSRDLRVVLPECIAILGLLARSGAARLG